MTMTEIRPTEKEGHYILDVKGYSCPYPQYYTIKAIHELKDGEVLEIVLDNQPSFGIVQDTAKKKGYNVLSAEDIGNSVKRILIKKESV